MPDLSDEDRLAKLKRVIQALKSFKVEQGLFANILLGSSESRSEHAPTFQKWLQDTGETIKLVFGEHSRYVDSFNDIKFGDRLSNLLGDEEGKKKAFSKGLDEAETLFRSMIEEIDKKPAKQLNVRAIPEQESKIVHTVSAPGRHNIQDSRNVFVVHGRNLKVRDSLFSFLRSIGLRPLEWSQVAQDTGKTAPYIGEILETAFSKAQAVVVLMTPDDKARVRKRFQLPDDPLSEMELTNQARPNVLFEAGMAMGRSPERTILVEVGKLRPFSDIGGRHIIKLNNSTQSRQSFAQRLENAGCPVDLTGTAWHTDGDFSSKDDTATG
jgi:predicted nucleotide-binding protein